MKYKLKLSKKAVKFLNKHSNEKEKIINIFKEIMPNYEKALKKYDIKQLKGTLEETYRLRIGKYRVIYKIYNDILVVYVLAIGSRGDIYKNLK
ncbi:type II toxin-antitoxin system RelE family toxin [Haliovirga abyssi]|uniref:Type II toxin-antitoxin system RelE/ParE family toxin n=1 Tax=Haliovirga abyssi TaxID=2996794 RepID=A0AAU9DSR0_9FUSO|nr:type II toxin-antitoxin system RelE/ParE family toxin [Haliovirga abyssi]BDU51673.1 hypothetical protein HLVA_22420 [Haliovirga abyssi]